MRPLRSNPRAQLANLLYTPLSKFARSHVLNSLYYEFDFFLQFKIFSFLTWCLTSPHIGQILAEIIIFQRKKKLENTSDNLYNHLLVVAMQHLAKPVLKEFYSFILNYFENHFISLFSIKTIYYYLKICSRWLSVIITCAMECPFSWNFIQVWILYLIIFLNSIIT